MDDSQVRKEEAVERFKRLSDNCEERCRRIQDVSINKLHQINHQCTNSISVPREIKGIGNAYRKRQTTQ
jgi:hypothetical protein